MGGPFGEHDRLAAALTLRTASEPESPPSRLACLPWSWSLPRGCPAACLSTHETLHATVFVLGPPPAPRLPEALAGLSGPRARRA